MEEDTGNGDGCGGVDDVDEHEQASTASLKSVSVLQDVVEDEEEEKVGSGCN